MKYKNRFHKHYHINKKEINEKRRNDYETKTEKGICVRCKRKAIKNIKLCKYHRLKQQEYNQKRIVPKVNRMKKQPKRLTGSNLVEFFANMEQNNLEKKDMCKYNIRGYTVTVKKRTEKYHNGRE